MGGLSKGIESIRGMHQPHYAWKAIHDYLTMITRDLLTLTSTMNEVWRIVLKHLFSAYEIYNCVSIITSLVNPLQLTQATFKEIRMG